MHEFLFFMIGFLLGGVIGISIMCLMQINRIHAGSNARGGYAHPIQQRQKSD